MSTPPAENGVLASEEKENTRENPVDLTDNPEDNTEPSDATEESESESEHETNNTGSESDSDEYESSEEEEEEEDDDEPALKYERITGFIPDLIKKDAISALTPTLNRLLVLGTHGGWVHITDLTGKRISSYKLHQASITDVCIDVTGDYVSTASMDGKVVARSIAAPETYTFDYKRPMRTVSMEPNFAKKSTRAVVCGGLAGTLSLQEKGWLGHKETVLHNGEGPIWQVRWQDRLIAWANDLGVKIYDTQSQTRITFIERPSDSPRADLFKCSLHWQDSSTLLIAWADYIKVARIRTRPQSANQPASSLPPLLVEITSIFQISGMVAGITPHSTPNSASAPPTPQLAQNNNQSQISIPSRPSSILSPTPSLTSLLIFVYTPPDESFSNELSVDTRRKAAERPELRIISRAGEELAADALSVSKYERWACNDYILISVPSLPSLPPVGSAEEDRSYIVVSPEDVILVKPRDKRDHVSWLLERGRYEEAMAQVELYDLRGEEGDERFDLSRIGTMYLESLVNHSEYGKAAALTPKVCKRDSEKWEEWIFVFADKKVLSKVIPFVPTKDPMLKSMVYEMMLAHFISQRDYQMLFKTIKEWPKGIYDIPSVIEVVRSEMDRLTSAPSTSKKASASPAGVPEPSSDEVRLLMESLAELYTANRQPGKALPYFLRLKRPNVFDLIRENNLFTDVQDQALLLVEFDSELKGDKGPEEAIELLVEHIHSIPIARVVQQLQNRPEFLFLYLDALVKRDASLVAEFADLQVKLYAEFAPPRLIDFLRASNSYNLETAYAECDKRDLVPEMVFLLGEMGGYKKALNLIIERLGDVNRAIDFAKERKDDDLWEDLLKYSETRPAFIRGLLENVGPEIGPIRLIRRIKNGLEIPGLKEALIKILQDFQLQMSLLEGCQTILDGDSSTFSRKLQKGQNAGYFVTAKTLCPICNKSLQETPQSLVMAFLCRHVVHAHCVSGADEESFPDQRDRALRTAIAGLGFGDVGRDIGSKIAFESALRARVTQGCPVCHNKAEGSRTS